MPSEPMLWDRKKFLKVMKEGRADSVGSEESREVTRCTASAVRKRPGEAFFPLSLCRLLVSFLVLG